MLWLRSSRFFNQNQFSFRMTVSACDHTGGGFSVVSMAQWEFEWWSQRSDLYISVVTKWCVCASLSIWPLTMMAKMMGGGEAKKERGRKEVKHGFTSVTVAWVFARSLLCETEIKKREGEKWNGGGGCGTGDDFNFQSLGTRQQRSAVWRRMKEFGVICTNIAFLRGLDSSPEAFGAR